MSKEALMSNLPIIGITLGEPAGIGPEITAKLFKQSDLMEFCRPVVVGNEYLLKDGLRLASYNCEVEEVNEDELSAYQYGRDKIPLINIKNMQQGPISYGCVKAEYGKAAGEYIEKTIHLCMDKKIDAMVTNPIHKDSFRLGGYGEKYPGHTEMCAALTGTKKYSMMLAHGSFRVIHVTTHIPFRKILDFIKKDNVLNTIRQAHETCCSLGIQKPRIAVAGINPHAGDGGVFGDEEKVEILPAIEAAQKEGMNALGPIPADSVFAKAVGGAFDIVVVMYHDQGHIPVKTLGFQWDGESSSFKSVEGINVTLGLPIIRTSVDHGTAFGKAGKGIADEKSLYNAVTYAVALANKKCN